VLSRDELRLVVARAQAGDKQAFDKIVESFQDMAVGFAYSLLSNFEQAEDAAQEAFLRAYLDLAQLAEHDRFGGWFRAILFHQCGRMTRRRYIPSVPLSTASHLASDTPSPWEHLDATEREMEAAKIVDSLPDRERPIVVLFYMDSYSQQEIAQFLDVPVNTVKKRLQSARKRLHERMLAMVQDTIKEQQPSRDREFAERVRRMIEAVERGDTSSVEGLVAEGLPVDTMLRGNSETAINIAAYHGHGELVEKLIALGADLNVAGGPAHFAYYGKSGGKQEVIDLMREFWRKSPFMVDAGKVAAQGEDYRIHEMRLREVPAKSYLLATSREPIAASQIPEVENRIRGEVNRILGVEGVKRTGPNVFIYTAVPEEASRFLLELGCEIELQKEGTADPLRITIIPGYLCASVVYVGPVPKGGFGAAMDYIGRRIAEEGYRKTGRSLEIYHYWEHYESEANITEIQFLVEKA
jgi:RNA polymerase sigma-70 factor (ECF subfamily)